MMFIPVLFSIIALHGADGREVDVNPAEITSLREARSDDPGERHFVSGAHCLINLTDGKFVAVAETCAQTRVLISDEVKRLQEIVSREYKDKGFEP
jgi:hypothetical protein